MRQVIIVTEPFNVSNEISALGLQLAIVQKVARAAAAGRASALDIDVAFAPGMFSYILGNRHLRLQLLPYGWRTGRFNNVESVVNDDLGIQIVFQNVDIACDPFHLPQAISGKGAGARQLVQQGLQGELWDVPVNLVSQREQSDSKRGVTPVVWMFCVSDDGKRLRAELSKPDNFEGNQFEDFSKRIFLIDEEYGSEDEVPVGSPSSDDDSGFDIDIEVVRK